jgi:hypothetical protein
MTDTERGNLLSAIGTAGKYVALDLSSCTMTGTFDPGTANTGEKYIVSLVLPDAATGIKAGSSPASTFKNFTALKSVSGEGVKTVGEYAFRSCTGLTSVDLPAATSISYAAFSYCTGLTTVDLPAATSLGNNAFAGCTGLTSVDLPAATSIDYYAFYGCTGLTTVDFPAAISIGNSAFEDCTGLTTVNLPAATSIGNNAFVRCTGLTTVNLPEATSIDYHAFRSTGNQTITITLGATAPTLEYGMFFGVSSTKIVTVKVPSGATGYNTNNALPVTITGSDTTENWGNGFRGGGWDGNAIAYAQSVNSYISLTIKTQQ